MAYKITCNKMYIGKTKNHLVTLWKQNKQKSSTSEITDYLKSDFNSTNVKITDKQGKQTSRLTLEIIHLKQNKNTFIVRLH